MSRIRRQWLVHLALGTLALLAASPLLGNVTVVGTVLSDNGDDDGFPDTNETVQMWLVVQNDGAAPVSVVTATLSTDSPWIACLGTSTVAIGPLAPGETATVPEPFVFTVADVDRAALLLDPLDEFSVAFDVQLLQEFAEAGSRTIQLSLDLDGLGGAGPTSFGESFESGTLGSFGVQNIDLTRHSLAGSDGYRCQYSDPDWTGSNSYGSDSANTCFLGSSAAAADAIFWQVDGSTNPESVAVDGGRAYDGTHSAYYGILLDAALGHTTPMSVLEAIGTTDPINLGWDRACSASRTTPCFDAGDCPSGEECVTASPTLSFKHQISLLDGRSVGVPSGETADRGVVAVQLADANDSPLGPWIKIYPYVNLYNQAGTDNYTNCLFDPVDDGSDEDDYFDPADPERRLGPSSTCYPELTFAHQGDTFWPFSAANVGLADGPGLPGSLGIGTWVEPRFDLEAFRGKRIRLRFLATSLDNGATANYEQAFQYNPDPGDDGWWIDDVQISDTLVSPATLLADDRANAGLPGLDDLDGDLLIAACDNCDSAANAGQADLDFDGVGDVCDNCPADENPAQIDSDLDGLGDSCDRCPLGDGIDGDGDGLVCASDNCPEISNAAQVDADSDGVGDSCDACPTDPGNDVDGDGLCADADNCASRYNPDQGPAVRLIDDLPAFGDVEDFLVAPDGSTVVYRADRDENGRLELYSAPLTGGVPRKLNPAPIADGSVNPGYALSPDSRTVVYLGDLETDGTIELYATSLDDGSVVKLNPPLVSQGSVDTFQISPDGQRVVYVADQEIDQLFELYSVPIAGGPGVKLNGTLPQGAYLERHFVISPDGARVIYISTEYAPGRYDLSSVSILGGIAAHLTATLPPPAEIPDYWEDAAISTDGNHVVFAAYLGAAVFHAYGVPIDGGTVILLSDDPQIASVRPEYGVRITADGARAIYLEGSGSPSNLFSSALIGGSTIQLDGQGQVVSSFQLTANGSRVVYGADSAIYSAGFTGGYRRLSGSDPALAFQVSPDGSRVVYVVDDAGANVVELYSVAVTGGASVKVHPDLPSGRSVSTFEITADSANVIYLADQDTLDLDELYFAPIGGGASTRLSGTLTPGGEIFGFQAASDATTAVYRSDQVHDHQVELFATSLDPDSDGDGTIGYCGDCDDAEAAIHPDAPEVNDGLDNQCPGDDGHGVVDEISGNTGFLAPGNRDEYSWPAQAGATSYEVGRSTQPDFSSGCVFFPATGSTVLIDTEVPPAGTAFHYLSRALAPNAGSWGEDSSGVERVLACGP